MNTVITKNRIIILISAIVIASFSVFYVTAGIFKANTQVVNDLTSELVGYWTFDGQDADWGANTGNDLSGNNNTRTMMNMATSTSPVPGVVGQALKFVAGSSNFVRERYMVSRRSYL